MVSKPGPRKSLTGYNSVVDFEQASHSRNKQSKNNPKINNVEDSEYVKSLARLNLFS